MGQFQHPGISFCTTCKGRTYHLKETLPRNLALCRQFLNDFEFVLVNYSSGDDMDDWVHSTFSYELSSGAIKYVKTSPSDYFFMAHAKNVAHRQATKSILVNLDADNFLSIFYLYLLTRLQPNEIMYVQWIWQHHFMGLKGIHGRIAVYKDLFECLGGYDESLTRGWGYEDLDFANRATAYGARMISLPPAILGDVISHSDEERTEFSLNKDIQHEAAEARSNQRVAQGILVANQGKNWGAPDFSDFDLTLPEDGVSPVIKLD